MRLQHAHRAILLRVVIVDRLVHLLAALAHSIDGLDLGIAVKLAARMAPGYHQFVMRLALHLQHLTQRQQAFDGHTLGVGRRTRQCQFQGPAFQVIEWDRSIFASVLGGVVMRQALLMMCGNIIKSYTTCHVPCHDIMSSFGRSAAPAQQYFSE